MIDEGELGGGGDSVPDVADKFAGVLLGTAVGDALGLPREGLSPERARRLFGSAPLQHRFIRGRGMISDDTEHACLVAQALLVSGGEPARFARSLAWRLRGWLLAMPAAIGMATLRAIIKLWLGWRPDRSGVASAGNGPAMRAPLIGAFACWDRDRLVDLVRASTRMTHTDQRAEEGALAIALAAQFGMRCGPLRNPAKLIAAIHEHVEDPELLANLRSVERHLARGASAAELAQALGLERGVTGFINHTVPVALFCWLRYGDDFRRAVEEVILLGGDTDSTGAVVGGLTGAALGAGAIPQEWLAGIAEWPRSISWMRGLSARLAESMPRGGRIAPGRGVSLAWAGLLPRNVLFAATVLLHALRRLLPPY